MYSKLKSLCICFLLACTYPMASVADAKQQSVTELQLLIDVSGSMKKNDPKNLRIPAVKLLVNLLPEGTKAGIWLFAQKTTMLVETAVVNEKWKKNALSKITKIHAAGLFTNIEEAIHIATQEWLKLPGEHHRNLILLTDGMVDVSKDIMQSAESRERIMVEQIPQLQLAGIKVQTIALSDNADAELLKKLAFGTNGWSEIAQSAEQLQKVFFNMFKKAVPQDTVPIAGNKFNVDASIKEFSVLIFKKPGAVATKLYAPDNTEISHADHVANVSWIEEKTYDLVSIKTPKQGEWKIVAEMDPDNQVMIVTDLKFQVDETANHISEQEAFEVTAFFTDQQQLISRDDFLNLIDISIVDSNEQGEKSEWKMSPVSGKAGLFSQSIGGKLEKGKHTLKIIADGKTFKRESVRTFDVVTSPVQIETEVNVVARTVRLKLEADEAVINTKMMTVQAIISQSNKGTEHKEMEKINGTWVLEIAVPEQGGSRIINFSIMAKTVQGNPISLNVKPVVINESLFTKLDVEAKPEISPPEMENTEEEVELNGGEPEDEIIVEEKAGINWVKTSLIVVGMNVFFITVGFFGFKFMKKKMAEKQEKLLDRLA
ncbi:MAG: vWA domain-containing protein [Methylococcaceae bacterium]